MLKTIEIINADNDQVIATFQTTSSRLRDAVYKYKKHNNITIPTNWREVGEAQPIPPKAPIDPRVPTFDNLKDNTRKAYRQHLDNFFKQGGNHTSYDSIKAYYDKIPSTSKQAFLYAVMLMNPNEDFKRRLKGLVRESFDEVRQIRADRPRGEPAITLDRVREIANRKEHKNNWIVQWYAYGIPWRADTITHIIKGNRAKAKDKRELNTFYPRKKIIHMEHFKTKSSHGSKDIKLTPLQVKILNAGFKASGTNKLLTISADTLIHRLRSIFGVGINALRHAHITEARQKMNPQDFRTFVNNMNTSVQVALEAYDDN